MSVILHRIHLVVPVIRHVLTWCYESVVSESISEKIYSRTPHYVHSLIPFDPVVIYMFQDQTSFLRDPLSCELSN